MIVPSQFLVLPQTEQYACGMVEEKTLSGKDLIESLEMCLFSEEKGLCKD